MAVLKIYPGNTGMRESLAQIEQFIGKELEEAGKERAPRSAEEMLDVEECNQARARRVGDLWTAKRIVEAHLEAPFVEECLRMARERLRQDGAKRIKSCGWVMTRLELRGGLKMKLRTPYLRSSHAERRSKRGAAGSGLHPVLSTLGFDQGFTPASRSEIARQAVLSSSYAEAREQLGRHGLWLDAQSIGRVAARMGLRSLQLRRESLEAAVLAPLPQHSSLAGKRVRLSLDGGRTKTRSTSSVEGIRPGKNKRRAFETAWREPRVLTIDVLDEDGEMDRRHQPIYETTLGDADATLRLLVGTLRLLGVHLAEKVLFVADGADWIWRRIADALLDEVHIEPERLFLALDYYHATEHIAEALAACGNLDSTARETLLHELRAKLLQPDGAKHVIERLRMLARGRRAKLINQHIGYLHSRLAYMDYSELRQHALSIGSGVVESAVRRIVNLRFKSASMCWRADHLEPLLYLRASLKSGRWNQLFLASLLGRHWLEPNTSFILLPKNLRPIEQRRRAAA